MSSKGASLSYVDAAERIFLDVGQPMKYSELAKKAIQKRLIHTESKTPEISMYISLRDEIARRDLRGEPQRFLFLSKGMFALVAFMTAAIGTKTKSAVQQIRESRQEACKKLYEKLTDTNQGDNLETMVSDLLLKMGYEDVQSIGGKDDQGVDILALKRDGLLTVKIAIQCKCKKLSNEIGPKDVSSLRDNLSTYQCQQGIFVTTSRLNDTAKAKAKEAGKEPIHQIEHGELLELFARHEIGLRKEALSYFQVDSSTYEFLGCRIRSYSNRGIRGAGPRFIDGHLKSAARAITWNSTATTTGRS